MGLKREQVLSPGKYKQVVAARSVVCYWCMRELGISQSALAKTFGMSQPAISMAVKRGEKVVKFHKFSLLAIFKLIKLCTSHIYIQGLV